VQIGACHAASSIAGSGQGLQALPDAIALRCREHSIVDEVGKAFPVTIGVNSCTIASTRSLIQRMPRGGRSST
jgi:hypothetical protein